MGAKSIHLTLGEHLAPFQALCQKNNTSMQEALRHFVATEIGKQKILIKGIPFGAKKLRSKRLGLNLTDAESKALVAFALQENITPGNWLIQRLQDAMASHDGSAIGRVELKRCMAQLDKIQRDLVGMCTNLNQVARKVNSRVNPDDRIPPERLLVLKHIENTMLELVRSTQTIVERFEHSRHYPYPQKQ